MKKVLITLFCFFGSFVFAQNNIYSTMYNMLGSNIYTTGNYTISMYDEMEAAKINVINYNGQGIAAIGLISNSKYTNIDYSNFMSGFFDVYFNTVIDRSELGAIRTNRGLILSGNITNTLFISLAVLNSDYSVKEEIYRELLKPFFENKEFFIDNLRMLGDYKYLKEQDPILISSFYIFFHRNSSNWWTNADKTKDVFLLSNEDKYYIVTAEKTYIHKEEVFYSRDENLIIYSNSNVKYRQNKNGTLDLISDNKIVETFQ